MKTRRVNNNSRGNKRAFALDLKRIEITAIALLLLLLGSTTVASALEDATTTNPVAQKAGEIRGEIAKLLEQVSKLQQQLKELQHGDLSTSTPSGEQRPKRICPLIARALLFGSHGDDVEDLQEFLAEEGYFDRKNVSAYFGPLTQSALRKWQAVQGIISSGSASSTGWGTVGPRTKEFIFKRCGGWREDKPFPPFGSSTLPRLDKKWATSTSACPTPAMPPLASCSGKLRLEWNSKGDSFKCLAWKCLDDDDDDQDEDNDSDDDSDEGSSDDSDDTQASSTNSN